MNNTYKKIFGTDGVRGTANLEPVTAETALRLGRAAGHVFKNLESQARDRSKHKIVIGKDTRLSGYMLEPALAAGFTGRGMDVVTSKVMFRVLGAAFVGMVPPFG